MRLKRMGNKTDWRNSAKEMFCSEQGSALVEFALCLPMLVVVLAGIVDYGEMIQVSMLVTQAASTWQGCRQQVETQLRALSVLPSQP